MEFIGRSSFFVDEDDDDVDEWFDSDNDDFILISDGIFEDSIGGEMIDDLGLLSAVVFISDNEGGRGRDCVWIWFDIDGGFNGVRKW